MDNYNFYMLLGVSQNATKDEILTRYKELVSIYHPDKAGDKVGEILKEINHAKDVLLNPKKRAVHDNNIKYNFGKFAQSNEDSQALLNAKIKKLLLENKNLKSEVKRINIEYTTILNECKWLRSSLNNKSIYIEKLLDEIGLLKTKESTSAPKQYSVKVDNSNTILETNKVLKDTIHKLESENKLLNYEFGILKDRYDKLNQKKLTSAGCSLILVSVCILLISSVWLFTGHTNLSIVGLIIGCILFIVGLRGR